MQETWQNEGSLIPVKKDCTVLIYTGTHQCQLPLSEDKVEMQEARVNTLG